MDSVTLDDIRTARERGRDLVLATPLLASHAFTDLSDRAILLKAENLQRAGSFKVRGAINALSQLSPEERERGVVAASAGNHAQGVALAGAALGIPVTVFMPQTAPLAKEVATRGYGADVRSVGDNIGDAIEAAGAHVAETGARLIHPYDDPRIVAGQGSLGLELLEQIPDPPQVVVPVGGGGLIAGSAIAIKALSPTTRIVGVEAEAMPLYTESRRAGRPVDVAPRPTVADGIAIPTSSALTFDAIERYVDDLVTVDEDAIYSAVTMLLERAKLLVEPAGAVPVAALLGGLLPATDGPTVLVLSGGNIDLLLVGTVVRHGLETRGRFASLQVRVPDVPGELRELTAIIGDRGANVLAIEHHREGVGLPFGYVEIRIAFTTRGPDHFDEIMEALTASYEVIRSSSPGTSTTDATRGS